MELFIIEKISPSPSLKKRGTTRSNFLKRGDATE